MKVKIKTSFVLAAMLATSTMFFGCGGSSSSDTQGEETPVTPDTQAYSLSGVAVKGYLNGAEVWIDLNDDGLKSSDELTTTDENGRYSFDIPNNLIGSRMLEVSGGVDSSTQEPFMGNLRAVFDSTSSERVIVTSPISSLVASRVAQGDSLDVAQGKISQALGLSISDLTKDPIAEASKEGGNSELFKKSLQIARVTELISKNSDDGSSEDSVLDALIDAIESGLDLDTAIETVAQAKITDADKKASITTLSNAIKDMVIIQSNDPDTMKKTIDSIESATKVATLTMAANPVAKISVNNIAEVIKETPVATGDKIDLTKLADALKNTDTSSEDFNPIDEAQSIKDQVVVDVNPPAEPETGDTETGDTETGETETGDTETGDAETGGTTTGGTTTGGTTTGGTTTGGTTTGGTTTGGTTTTPVTTQTKNINASTSPATSDAGSLASTYTFAAANYTYTISGFGDNDVLKFPQGNTPTIRNSVSIDGKLTIQWAYNGAVIEVVLTGITPEKGGSIFGMTSFNTAFGADSIQVQQ